MKEYVGNKNLFILSLLLLLFLSAGCTSDDVTTYGTSGSIITPGTTAGTPSTVDVQLSSSSIANGGNTTVTATVTDALGDVVPDVEITFTVASSTAGSFSPGSATTASDGTVTTTFTAASPAADDSTATIYATVTSGTSMPFGYATITIGNPPQVPASISVTLAASSIANGGTTTVTATVLDGSSAPISGAAVTFTLDAADSGKLTFSTDTATTNASGQASVTVSATSSDTVADIYASAGTVSNSATLTIGTPVSTPTSMSMSINPLSVSIASQTSVSVTVMGEGGDPAYNIPVTLTISPGISLASFSTGTTTVATTNSSGVASATITTGESSGTVTVTASVAGLTDISASFMITSDPATISLSIVDSELTTNESTQVSARVLNVMGQPVSNGTIVTFTPSENPPGSLSSTTASTINGVATVTFNAGSTSGSAIIYASAGTLDPVNAIIVVNPALAGTLEYVSVDPSSGVVETGSGSAVVTFIVKDVSGNALPDQSVSFDLTLYPCGATLGSTSDVSDSSGNVTVQVRAGACAGPVLVTASTIVPTEPPQTLYAKSPNLSIGGGVPSYKWLSLSVEKFNVPALNCDGATDEISVRLADRFGNYNILQGTSVSFHTAYGAIDTNSITDAEGYTSAIFRSQEPRSPDGQVRILVHTTGEENYTEMNANGVYDAGIDTFAAGDDLPEPFIDADHDSVHDSGELFWDWPATVPGATPTGTYSSANGQWDASIPIWKSVDIWMTGPPYVNAGFSEILCEDPSAGGALTNGDISIPNGSSVRCYVYSADENGNALAADTTISLSSDESAATITHLSGPKTVVDAPVTGRLATVYKVKNGSTETSDIYPTLTATIVWPGSCGTLETIFSYDGVITFLPPAP